MSTENNDTVKALELQVKKLTRALEKERILGERTRANAEAKHHFSEIVQAERSHLERNMRLMLHHSSNMILFFDANGVIDFCADLFLTFKGIAGFGFIKGQTLRQLTSDFLPDEFISRAEQMLAQTLSESAGKEEPFVLTCETNCQTYSNVEGEVRDFLVEAVLLTNEDGEKNGLLVELYDTTEYSRAQRSAEQANLAKSDFLATVSHEIRTPMNAIVGLTDMLRTTEMTSQQQEYLDKIQASSTTMLALINDILDFSRIEADKLELIHEHFELGRMLGNIEAMFDVMMAQKELAFTTNFDSGLPEVVWGDEKRVQQVLTNILNNAYKYTPFGSVHFMVKQTSADVVSFSIIDTGVGIREEDIDSLFKEFKQLDLVRNKHISGTGLGLAITKHLVEMMNGMIEVDSSYGEGSTFTVLLPLKKGEAKDLPRVEAESLEFTAPEASVLIVDDVEVNIEIAEFMLLPFEVAIAKARNGAEAVEMARNQRFDLILMDQMMPVMDGIEATKAIRAFEGAAGKVPIVALTANAIKGMENTFKDAGFDGFVTKPIDMILLARTLYSLLPDELIVE